MLSFSMGYRRGRGRTAASNRWSASRWVAPLVIPSLAIDWRGGCERSSAIGSLRCLTDRCSSYGRSRGLLKRRSWTSGAPSMPGWRGCVSIRGELSGDDRDLAWSSCRCALDVVGVGPLCRLVAVVAAHRDHPAVSGRGLSHVPTELSLLPMLLLLRARGDPCPRVGEGVHAHRMATPSMQSMDTWWN